MQDPLTMSLLYDTYGALLTDKQAACFELYYHQDLSLTEIAEEEGISRQGVHDSIARAENALRHFEQTLGNVRRDRQMQQALQTITRAAQALRQHSDPAVQAMAETIFSATESIKE